MRKILEQKCYKVAGPLVVAAGNLFSPPFDGGAYHA